LPFERRSGGIGHLAHAPRGVTSAALGEHRRAQQKIRRGTLIFLAIKQLYTYVRLAQIRTCLWPCVDR
jgi:hypothetical protein